MKISAFQFGLVAALIHLGPDHPLVQAFWGAYRWRLTQSDYVQEGPHGMGQELERALALIPSYSEQTPDVEKLVKPEKMDASTFTVMCDQLTKQPEGVIWRLRSRISRYHGSEDALESETIIKQALEQYVAHHESGLCPGPG